MPSLKLMLTMDIMDMLDMLDMGMPLIHTATDTEPTGHTDTDTDSLGGAVHRVVPKSGLRGLRAHVDDGSWLLVRHHLANDQLGHVDHLLHIGVEEQVDLCGGDVKERGADRHRCVVHQPVHSRERGQSGPCGVPVCQVDCDDVKKGRAH